MNKTNLFIVGAGKSGTTALANQLSHLDEVFLPSRKEPHYFAMYDDASWAEVDHFGSTYIQDIEQYQQLYAASGGQKYLIDASTSYLHRTGTAARIHAYNADAKIIMLLRNPVDRAYSHYLMSKRVGYTRSDFLSAIKNEYLDTDTGLSHYVKIGLYSPQITEYLNIFPHHAIKIILYDDYSSNIERTFRELLTFLELDCDMEITSFLSARHNETLFPRNRLIASLARNRVLVSIAKRILGSAALDRVTDSLYSRQGIRELTPPEREQCLAYFRDDIKTLESLIERDLSAWYAQNHSDQESS